MPEVKLVISMGADGQVNVEGPLSNRVLCYGLLEAAKDAIRNFETQKSGLVRPVPLPFGRG